MLESPRPEAGPLPEWTSSYIDRGLGTFWHTLQVHDGSFRDDLALLSSDSRE